MATNSGPDTPTQQDIVAFIYDRCTGAPAFTKMGEGGISKMTTNLRALNSATHLCIGTLGPETNNSGNLYRGRSNVVDLPGLQLDDIGKLTEAPPLMPTYNVETSPGNCTYLYKFTRAVTPEEYEVISHSMREAGYGDPNCADPTRLFRLPGSKPPGKEHAAKLLEWNTDCVYDPDTFLEQVNVRALDLEHIKAGHITPKPAPPGTIINDDVKDWLEAEGHLISDDTGGWVKIRCPWAHTHSEKRDVAKYKPADEQDVRRVFYCHHSHEHNTEDFLDWVFENGGPEAQREVKVERTLEMLVNAGITGGGILSENVVTEQENTDRLANMVNDELIPRYVWFSPKGTIFDLYGPENYPMFTERGLAGKWAEWRLPSLTPANRPTTINVMQAWAARGDKMETSMMPHLDPREKPGWTGEFINTWKPFQPAPDSGVPATEWIKLIKWVFPDDWEYAMDWFAYKLQKPWARMVALVSYTPIGGTGRNTTMHIMRQLIGNSAHMTASRLFGDKANQFNAHLSNLLLTIGEVDEGSTEHRGITKKVYNRLKELVDPDETSALLERKGQDAEMVEIFTSFFIATNAGAGLPLEEGERRFSITRGNDERLPDSMEQWVARIRNGNTHELSKVWHYLNTRDVSNFRPNYALESDAKQEMINEGKGEVDTAIEDALKDLSVFTANGLYTLIRDNMRHMSEADLKRQINGWTRSHSSKPKWVKNNQGVIKLDGKTFKPRVKNSTLSRRLRFCPEEAKNQLSIFLERVGVSLSKDGTNVVRLDRQKDDEIE